MRNRIALLTLPFLAAFSIGCSDNTTTTSSSGSDTTPSEMSISAVIPNNVFLGRTVNITISGYDTKWTDATQVNFGDGIAVLEKTVASPTAIVATIDIGAEATVGARDVKVTDAGGTSTYKGAFKIESPLDLINTGTVAQGSIFATKAKQLDLSTPFDTTSTGDGFFEPLAFTNLIALGSSGLTMNVSDVQLYSADMIVLADVNAPAGPSDFSIESGPAGGDTIASPAPKSLDIVARTPTPIPEGDSIKGKINEPLESLLYTFAPTGPGLYIVEASASSADANPRLAMLPKSGSFVEFMGIAGSTTVLATNTDPYYFIYWDNSGTSGYSTTVKATKVMTPETMPNDACAMALAAGALPANLKDMYMESDADVDWVWFDVPAGSEGKVVHVKTTPGDAETDTVLQVFQNCTTALGGPSGDKDYHEDLISLPIVAPGKHYVKVSNSTFGYTGKLYNLSIAIEDPPPPPP